MTCQDVALHSLLYDLLLSNESTTDRSSTVWS